MLHHPEGTVLPARSQNHPMRTWTEAILALGLTLVMGAAFWLFSGEPIGSGASGNTDGTAITVDAEAATRGETVAADAGCFACHTIDGTPSVGPTWKGLAGSSRPLESGETVIANDSYLHNSIIDPGSQVVAGFSNVMPATYSDQLSQSEIGDLVEYIKSLGS